MQPSTRCALRPICALSVSTARSYHSCSRAERQCHAASTYFVHDAKRLTGEPALVAVAWRVGQAVARVGGFVGGTAAYEAATACAAFWGERFVTRSAPPARHWGDAPTEHATATAAPKCQPPGAIEQRRSEAACIIASRANGIISRASGIDAATNVDVRGWWLRRRSNGRASGFAAATAARECLELGAAENCRSEVFPSVNGRIHRCVGVSRDGRAD